MILDEIVANKRQEVEALKESISLEQLKKQINECKAVPRSFKAALQNKEKPINMIAEVKKASPSKGLICEDFKPVEIAKAYEEGGASAISVLTEIKYFKGNNSYLEAVKAAVKLPVLRKDFIIDPWQIYESKAIGADAILLIVAVLTPETLRDYLKLAKELGMDALVETHSQREVETALEAGAEIIGVNNRNLKDFVVSLEVCEELRKYVPEDKVFVAESGIHTLDDMRRIKRIHADAVLIGEGVVKGEQRAERVKAFINA